MMAAASTVSKSGSGTNLLEVFAQPLTFPAGKGGLFVICFSSSKFALQASRSNLPQIFVYLEAGVQYFLAISR